MALLLARDDGTNNAAPSHSAEAGAEVEAEGELQSQTDKQREKTDPTIVHSDASRSFNHSDTSTGKDNRIRTLGHSSVDVFHRGVTDEDTEASSASAERLTPGRRAGRLHNPSLQNESDARHLTPEQLVAGKRGDSGETSDSDEDYVYSDSSEENDNQQESGTTYRLTTRGPMPSWPETTDLKSACFSISVLRIWFRVNNHLISQDFENTSTVYAMSHMYQSQWFGCRQRNHCNSYSIIINATFSLLSILWLR